ncbi:hypothetical protein HPB48_023369 [Haemaphysalis longicornis]|uniref:Uncharacterized protein n=1 Tax=Haemaphysalis longicornis TaxID=44386 RepID=A0A9J6GWF3_HAELO|nr:hypothetical protein HPB48_023369 [Haemaphysalis longicornis]
MVAVNNKVFSILLHIGKLFFFSKFDRFSSFPLIRALYLKENVGLAASEHDAIRAVSKPWYKRIDHKAELGHRIISEPRVFMNGQPFTALSIPCGIISTKSALACLPLCPPMCDLSLEHM